MCYSGYKGTIKRAKKQKYFDFSEREYLRSQFKGTIKRAKKQMKFDFSEPTNETRAEYARMLCLVRRRKTTVTVSTFGVYSQRYD